MATLERKETTVAEAYTCGIWEVDEGNEERFIEAFKAFAATASEKGGALDGLLLRDVRQRGRFIVVRHWRSSDEMWAWRESPDFDVAYAPVAEMASEDGTSYVTEKVADLGARS